MFTSIKSKMFPLFGLAACIAFSSCSDDKEDNPSYNVPEAYNFENVNYSGQTTRIAMLDELSNYIKSGNDGEVLEAQTMKNMYANANAPFESEALNSSGKQLKNKTIATAQPVFEQLFEKAAQTSNANVLGLPAQEGRAGILTSNDGTKTYLVDANGVEYAQVIQKGLMGAVFYYQAVEGYLSADKIGASVDNTTVTEGEGTPMEHHWDEAFGYFGAPTNFPANTTGTKYWANYSNQVNPALGSNKALMDAFLKGRAAISAKDMAGKDAAAATVRAEWEKLVAASAIHELNAAKNNLNDDAKKSHYLSEAIGFAMGLKYKTDRRLSDAKYSELLDRIGENLYDTTGDDIAAAIDILSTAYDFNSIKSQL